MAIQLLKIGNRIINMAHVVEVVYTPDAQLVITAGGSTIGFEEAYTGGVKGQQITGSQLNIIYNPESEYVSSGAVLYREDADRVWEALCWEAYAA